MAQLVLQQATGCIAWVQFPAGARDSSLLHRVQTDSDTHLASYTMSTKGSFTECVKQLGREADHSFLSTAEVMNNGAVPSFPPTSSWHSV
jgi:hypothetical protein